MMVFYDFLKKMHALFTLKHDTTLNCHLCELALGITHQLADTQTIQLIAISDDLNLLNHDETIIAILQRTDTLIELA